MELRGNIFFSIMLHATILTAALALAGKELIVRSPERFIAVSLFEDHAEEKSPAGTVTIKKPPVKISVPVSGRRPPPEAGAAAPAGSFDTIPRTTIMPATDPPGVSPLPTAGPTSDIETIDPAAPSGGNEGLSRGQLQAVTGSATGTAGRQGGIEDTVKGILPKVDAIRAAIEKAKRYPPLARERGFEGTVTAEFTISAEGYPENIRILRSSGYEILDAAAKKTLLRASPLPVVAGRLEVPITFRLER